MCAHPQLLASLRNLCRAGEGIQSDRPLACRYSPSALESANLHNYRPRPVPTRMAPHRGARFRAWSNSVFGRDPPPTQDKTASALHHLASAGLGLIISPTEEEAWAEQARNAASTVLQELERVSSLDPLKAGQLPREISIEVGELSSSRHTPMLTPLTGRGRCSVRAWSPSYHGGK